MKNHKQIFLLYSCDAWKSNDSMKLLTATTSTPRLLENEKVDIREQKVDIGTAKVDIGAPKVDIERVLSEKGKEFSVKTTVHVYRLFEKFGDGGIFGRSATMELLGLKSSSASKFLSNLLQADIIEAVSGQGKGKYRFKT